MIEMNTPIKKMNKIISIEIKLEKKTEILAKKLTTVIIISSDFILFLKKLTTDFILTSNIDIQANI